jgi:hypothetical protein
MPRDYLLSRRAATQTSVRFAALRQISTGGGVRQFRCDHHAGNEIDPSDLK